MELQPKLVQTVTETFPEGKAWLNALPETLAALCAQWGLTLLLPYPDLSCSYVVPALQKDGSSAVLKVCVPHPEFSLQIEALTLYGGKGMVKLLKADAEVGALLLERIEPGVTLWSLCTETRDAELTAIAARLMKQTVHLAPPPSSLPTIQTWMTGFEKLRHFYGGGTGAFPRHLVEAAERLSRDLWSSSPHLRLLHGDLHHGNILSASEDSWLAIDPHGVIGEAAFEPAAFLHNPMPHLQGYSYPQRALDQRIEIFAEILGEEAERIRGWAIAHAVLAAWWGVEDGGKIGEDSLWCAERMLI